MANQDIYGINGGVPAMQPLNGTGGTPMGVKASPDDMGAAIGRGEEAIGQQGTQLADHYGGMMLETAANTAEASHIKDVADIEANYRQLEGSAAVNARPQFEQAILDSTQKYREQLPMAAQHIFDAGVNNFNAHKIGGFADYAATQAKSANIKSQDALIDTAISHAGDLSIVLDDKAFGNFVLSPITNGGNAIAKIHGVSGAANGINPDTGSYSYPDTPEGKAAEAQHMVVTNAKLASAYLTAAKTVADNQGAAASAAWVQKHWDDMPDAAKVQLNQYLAPKAKSEAIAGSIANMNSQIQSDYTTAAMKNIPSSPLQSPAVSSLDVIRKNEGIGYSKDNKGETVNGINSLAFPTEFAQAKQILDTQGQAAATKYTDNFYQKQIIEKNGIDKLPANTQAIVADGIVNHGAGDFGQSLISAAKNGATPSQLIDMRRQEYQRLNDTGKPEYTSQFSGWNNRLDNLQQQIGSPINKVDILKRNEDLYVQNAVNHYNQKYDDPNGALAVEKRARNEIQAQIKQEDNALSADRNTITEAINGSLTKGQPIATYEQLAALPNMKESLDRVHQMQPDFYGKIDTYITKAAHGDTAHNTPNGYDAIMNTLTGSDKFNRQEQIEYLSKGLGTENPGYSISQKDFNDAKAAIDLPGGKDFLAKQMAAITNANGNIDGKGQQRAMQWYNQTMAAYKTASSGDKPVSPEEFFTTENKTLPPINNPSRMQQIRDQANNPPTLTQKEQFDSLPNGRIYIRDGQKYRKP